MGPDTELHSRAERLPEEWDARQRWTRARFTELEPLRGGPRRSAEHAIVIRHLDLVDGLVRRMASAHHDQNDLRQVGCIGLVNAVRRYDPERGENFVAFAVPTISGEIKRYLRDQSWFVRPPRRLQELRLAASSAVPQLAQTLRREPTVTELAGYLGAPQELVAEAVSGGASVHPVSLDAGTGDDELSMGATIGVVDERLERADLRLSLRIALGQLTPRERRIVYLRFIEERTQREIAAEIGVTQMQVSRLLGKILVRLREQLEDRLEGRQAGSGGWIAERRPA
jgi:RNA polymerase sigma-B factor